MTMVTTREERPTFSRCTSKATVSENFDKHATRSCIWLTPSGPSVNVIVVILTSYMPQHTCLLLRMVVVAFSTKCHMSKSVGPECVQGCGFCHPGQA